MVRGCCQSDVKETKGQRKEKEVYVLGRVTTSDTQSPQEVFQSLALALPLGIVSSTQSCIPFRTSPPVEAVGWSCESGGGREKERTPSPSCPFPAVAGRGIGRGRGRERQRQKGVLEAEVGQQKGRALGTKIHLRICSASAEPPVLGHHGTAVGHGSVQEIKKWNGFSKESS